MSHLGCCDHYRDVANSPESPLAGLRGSMLVSAAWPSIVVPEFPPVGFKCPHGVTFWAYPDGDRVASLRELDYPIGGTS